MWKLLIRVSLLFLKYCADWSHTSTESFQGTLKIKFRKRDTKSSKLLCVPMKCKRQRRTLVPFLIRISWFSFRWGVHPDPGESCFPSPRAEWAHKQAPGLWLVRASPCRPLIGRYWTEWSDPWRTHMQGSINPGHVSPGLTAGGRGGVWLLQYLPQCSPGYKHRTAEQSRRNGKYTQNCNSQINCLLTLRSNRFYIVIRLNYMWLNIIWK